MKFRYILILGFLLLLTGCTTPYPVIIEPDETLIMYEPLYHLLDTNGNQTGITQATGNYVNETKFYIKPNSSEVYSIARILVNVQDTGGLDAGKYGNNIVLTNGVIIYTVINGITYNLTNSHPIITNADYGGLAYDAQNLAFGIGDDSLVVRFTFTKAGQPLILNGSNGDEFGVKLQDNFVGLTEHHFQVQGYDLSNKIYTIIE